MLVQSSSPNARAPCSACFVNAGKATLKANSQCRGAPMGFAAQHPSSSIFLWVTAPPPQPRSLYSRLEGGGLTNQHTYAYTHMHMNTHTWAFADKPMPYAWVSHYIPLPWPRERHGNQVWPITLWQSWDPNPNAGRASAWALTHTAGRGHRVLRVLRIPGGLGLRLLTGLPPLPPNPTPPEFRV